LRKPKPLIGIKIIKKFKLSFSEKKAKQNNLNASMWNMKLMEAMFIFPIIQLASEAGLEKT